MKIKFGDRVVRISFDFVGNFVDNSFFGFFVKHKFLTFFGLLFLVASLGVFIRVQNLGLLGDQLLALDPYIFLRYTKYIVDNGGLMVNDTMRVYPFGLSTKGGFLFLPYSLAYSYKFLRFFFPGLTVVEWLQLYPPVASFFAAFVLGFLGWVFFRDWRVGVLSTALTFFIHSFVFRTVAGFADKEPLGVLLLFSSFLFFVLSVRLKGWLSVVSVLLSGFFGALLGWTWGGFRYLIVSVGLYFLALVGSNNFSRKDLLNQFLWVVPQFFVFFLVNKENYFVDLSFLIFWLGVLSGLLHLLFYEWFSNRFPVFKRFPSGVLALISGLLVGLLVGLIVGGPGFVSDVGARVVDRLINPQSTQVVATSVSENQQPWFDPDWRNAFGFFLLNFFNIGFGELFNVFYLFFFGSVLLVYELSVKLYGDRGFRRFVPPLGFLVFLTVLVFSRYSAETQSTNFLSGFYLLSFPGFGLFGLWVFYDVWKRRGYGVFKRLDKPLVLLLIWFLFSVIGARGTIRLIFMLIPPAMILASFFVVRVFDFLRGLRGYSFTSLVWLGLVGLLVFQLFNVSVVSASRYGTSVVGEWRDAFEWIRDNTPVNSSFMLWWDYGYWIQTVAGRATVADGGHPQGFIGDHLIAKDVFSAYNVSQLLTALNHFGRPDYFFVVSDDIGKYYQMGRIGGLNSYYSTLYLAARQPSDQFSAVLNVSEFPELLIFIPTTRVIPVKEDFSVNGKLFSVGDTFVTHLLVPISVNNSLGRPLVVVQNRFYGQRVLPVNGVCEVGVGCSVVVSDGVPAFVSVWGSGAFWIPNKISNVLMTQLYLLSREIPGIDLVYESRDLYDPNVVFRGGENIRVYKFDYSVLEGLVESGFSW